MNMNMDKLKLKLLCINRLKLPDELLTIIKEYTHKTIAKFVQEKYKRIHPYIKINGSFFNKFNLYESNTWFLFVSYSKNKLKRFYFTFCPDCGNYLGQDLSLAVTCQCI